MAEDSILKKIRETFPKTTKDDWKRVASQEIDGKDPVETLQWKAGALNFNAYYDHSDSSVTTYLKNFQLPISRDPFGGPRTWVNLPKINVTNSATANRLALDHLHQGAEGVWFDLTQEPVIPLASLLEKIEWPFCSISFQMPEKNIPLLADYISHKNYQPHSLTGTIFWESLPDNPTHCVNSFTHQEKIYALGLIIAPSSPAEEISNALIKAVRIIDVLTQQGVCVATALRNIAFSVPINTNFFLEIAKVKALRMLWFQVAQAFGEKAYALHDLHIHARSEAWINEKFQPHSNMLKSTTASMAAILGGCDSLTVHAEDESNSMMNRIARNVSNILRDESHLNKVADAVAGSYALDTIVSEIATKAWAEFQIKSKQS